VVSDDPCGIDVVWFGDAAADTIAHTIAYADTYTVADTSPQSHDSSGPGGIDWQRRRNGEFR
jgi:hypothetical protein